MNSSICLNWGVMSMGCIVLEFVVDVVKVEYSCVVVVGSWMKDVVEKFVVVYGGVMWVYGSYEVLFVDLEV